ncbi:MAG: hypothetical protein ACYS8Z_22095 [Planctomycetota bacterium]|jgi:hypothetical protein
MESEKNGFTQREEGKSCEKLLEKLKQQLLSSNASIRRQAAFTLSWMQEDGLEILKETVFGDHPVSTKNAAAYGIRKMRGRMKKLALEVFNQGLEHHNSSTKEVCKHALEMMKTGAQKKPKKTAAKQKIQEVPSRKSKKKHKFQQTNWNR